MHRATAVNHMYRKRYAHVKPSMVSPGAFLPPCNAPPSGLIIALGRASGIPRQQSQACPATSALGPASSDQSASQSSGLDLPNKRHSCARLSLTQSERRQHGRSSKMQTIRHQLPRSLPGFIEAVENGFKSSEKATVADWKTDLRLSKKRGELPRPAVRRMVRLAKLLKLSDETPLLPRLNVLAVANVVSIRSTGGGCA
jgi:hypothetical protein